LLRSLWQFVLGLRTLRLLDLHRGRHRVKILKIAEDVGEGNQERNPQGLAVGWSDRSITV
jgi:hypothetical protein